MDRPRQGTATLPLTALRVALPHPGSCQVPFPRRLIEKLAPEWPVGALSHSAERGSKIRRLQAVVSAGLCPPSRGVKHQRHLRRSPSAGFGDRKAAGIA
jgi:hypothetical protein